PDPDQAGRDHPEDPGSRCSDHPGSGWDPAPGSHRHRRAADRAAASSQITSDEDRGLESEGKLTALDIITQVGQDRTGLEPEAQGVSQGPLDCDVAIQSQVPSVDLPVALGAIDVGDVEADAQSDAVVIEVSKTDLAQPA